MYNRVPPMHEIWAKVGRCRNTWNSTLRKSPKQALHYFYQLKFKVKASLHIFLSLFLFLRSPFWGCVWARLYIQSLSVDWIYCYRTGIGKKNGDVCLCVCVCVCLWTAWGLNYWADLAEIFVTGSWLHVVVCVSFLSLHHAWVTSQPPCCNSWGSTVTPSVLIRLTCGLQYR